MTNGNDKNLKDKGKKAKGMLAKKDTGEGQGKENELKNLSEGLAKGDTPDFQWFVIHTLTGHENKVCKALRERISNHHLESLFSEIFIPEETIVSNASGKKRTVKRKFFPGYILIKMVMNDKSWHLVKNTDKVTGFIGGTKERPAPISEDEAKFMMNQAMEGFKRSKTSLSFSEGDTVKVIEGPFASFIGTIENVSEKGKIRVQVSIFGRPTPVELDFTQVEKV